MIFGNLPDWLKAGPLGWVAVGTLGQYAIDRYLSRDVSKLHAAELAAVNAKHALQTAVFQLEDKKLRALVDDLQRQLGIQIEAKHVKEQEAAELRKQLHKLAPPGELDDLSVAIVGLMADDGAILVSELCETLEVSEVVIDDRLHQLAAKKFVLRRKFPRGKGVQLLQAGREWLRMKRVNP